MRGLGRALRRGATQLPTRPGKADTQGTPVATTGSVRQSHSAWDSSWRPVRTGKAERDTVDSRSPIFLEMDIPFHLNLRLIRLEAAALENFDHPWGLGKDPLPGFAVFRRHADHLRIAAKVHVRPLRVQRLAQVLLQ